MIWDNLMWIWYDIICYHTRRHRIKWYDIIWYSKRWYEIRYISTLQDVAVELGTVSEFTVGASAPLAQTETETVADIVELALAIAASLPDSLCDKEIIFLIPQEAGVVGWGGDWDWGDTQMEGSGYICRE